MLCRGIIVARRTLLADQSVQRFCNIAEYKENVVGDKDCLTGRGIDRGDRAV